MMLKDRHYKLEEFEERKGSDEESKTSSHKRMERELNFGKVSPIQSLKKDAIPPM